jgi:hypothetical protein
MTKVAGKRHRRMPQNKYTNLFLFSSLHFPGVIFASCEVFSYVYLSACEHELGISVVIDLKVYEYHSFCWEEFSRI